MKYSELYKYRAYIEKGATSLTDTDALDAVALFPAWAVGVYYEADTRIRYGEKLYKVVQAHTSQADWLPEDTPALYTEVAAPGQGDTPDNPIPYTGNMALEKDKYYSEDGIIYICFRDSGIALHNRLADLVLIYVNVYQPESNS